MQMILSVWGCGLYFVVLAQPETLAVIRQILILAERKPIQRADRKPLLENRLRYSAGLSPVIFLKSLRNACGSE